MGRKSSGHIYGPVPSRRLGRSLGIDLVPYKICSYDCVYCQLGCTTQKTVERKEYVPLDDLAQEIGQIMATGVTADYITLAGSGEPTLNSEIGSVISELKSKTDIPVAVLTNGSLLWNGEVRESILEADLILPSLDAASEATFDYVNRPDPEVTSEGVQEGYLARGHADRGRDGGSSGGREDCGARLARQGGQNSTEHGHTAPGRRVRLCRTPGENEG